VVSGVPLTGAATRAAAEAQAALSAGETVRAGARFEEAGKQLEAGITNARKQPDKQLARFLAATQYYKGGHYPKALALCRKIQADLLPAAVRPLYPRFRKDVEVRAAPDYQSRMRQTLLRHWLRQEYQSVLDLLQEHPYILPQGRMAFVRAVSCEDLKDYRAAAVFFADALRSTPQDPQLILTAAAYPLALVHEGRLSEAWTYLEHQLRLIPHAVTFVNACLVRYHQASGAATEEERRRLSEEQVRYFEEAWSRYQTLPPEQQNDQNSQHFMALGFEAAAFGLLRLGRRECARAVCNTAVEFSPSSPGPRTVRGLVTYPEPTAIDDFREAIRLGEESYYPSYFLAHAALVRGQFVEAEAWCQRALQQRPPRETEVQLFEWMALCRAQAGAPREQVRELFGKAQQLDPEDPRIRHNRDVFEVSIANGASAPVDQWNIGEIKDPGDRHLSQEEERLAGRNGLVDLAQRELATAG
jgi:tetratricopeptide (TPR) repeat protein